jgi:hypothetical protein
VRDLHLLDAYRLTDRDTIAWFGSVGDRETGAFMVPSPIDRAPMVIIASAGFNWDHVSVSRRNRAPNQRELDYVFRLFFNDDETAVQYFVPRSQHVNNSENCLHLWRPHHLTMPQPRSELVGIGTEPVRNAAEARKLRDEAMQRMRSETL